MTIPAGDFDLDPQQGTNRDQLCKGLRFTRQRAAGAGEHLAGVTGSALAAQDGRCGNDHLFCHRGRSLGAPRRTDRFENRNRSNRMFRKSNRKRGLPKSSVALLQSNNNSSLGLDLAAARFVVGVGQRHEVGEHLIGQLGSEVKDGSGF